MEQRQVALDRKAVRLERYVDKMISLKKELMKMSYDVKLYELTESYAFYFDIYKVMSRDKSSIFSKMCFCFYYFLSLKMLYFYYSSGIPIDVGAFTCRKKHNAKEQMSCRHEERLANGKDRANTVNNVGKIENEESKRSANKRIDNINEESLDLGHYCLMDELKKANDELKEAYFELNESFKNKDRVAKLEIISFLITLISPEVLHPIVENIEFEFRKDLPQIEKKNEQNHKEFDSNSKFDIEEEVYIVLTYQTLGTLVSQSVFSCLRKKYIKQTIFQQNGDLSYVRLIKSLKHIKEKLSSQKNVLIKGRKQREKEKEKVRRNQKVDEVQNESQSLTKEAMKDFIKSALKQKDLDLKQFVKPTEKENELEELNNKLKESFYPSVPHGEKRLFTKIALPNESSIKKHSISVKTKLDLENYRSSQEKQIKKKKFVPSHTETFYKFKQIDKKPESLKTIRTCRPSLKCSNLESSKDREALSNIEKENFSHIKAKLECFKEEALKDLRSIEKFKPYRVEISKAKENVSRASSENENSESWKNKKAALEQRCCSEQRGLETRMLKISLLHKEKEEVWHEMYNLKNETKRVEVHKKLESIPKFDTKVSRNSDNLRKFQKEFMEDCKKRATIILEDKIIFGQPEIQ